MAQCRVCKNSFYMHGDICDDCFEDEYFAKKKAEIKKVSSGGIASYYTSPLALQVRYESETGNKPTADFEDGPNTLTHYTNAYVQWLECKLVRKAGE